MSPIEDGFGVELVGEIAKLIELSAETESSQFENHRSSVKVVAGAGFEPATFRL
jgi:site-specific DNA recombinase